ncbi:amino acid ABC transporter substrate-binding protein [Cupriavidus oxalaticus]|nr:amino acid ABC transporter substrate-binding protein [Cupriavidus oxalaticus]
MLSIKSLVDSLRRYAANLSIVALCAMFSAAPASAQQPGELSGTLKKAKEGGTLSVGYRESSLPFSYLGRSGNPIGYSIDICRAIVAVSAAEVGREVSIRWVPVTSENRFDAISSGKIDLECGSTTRNAERMQRVAFSPVIFVAGTKLMVPKTSPIRTLHDLKGKYVVATGGTTNVEALERLSDRFDLQLKIIRASDHGDAFRVLQHGGADAYAGDDALLHGLLSGGPERGKFRVTSDFLSYDPYGIMYRKGDPQFAAVVEKTFRELAASRELERLYKQWFMMKLPTGERLGLPMSAQLEELIRAMPERAE